jgi:hypothetical protein
MTTEERVEKLEAENAELKRAEIKKHVAAAADSMPGKFIDRNAAADYLGRMNPNLSEISALAADVVGNMAKPSAPGGGAASFDPRKPPTINEAFGD